MKLLFDENLSRKLLVRLAQLYPGSAHVETFDLLARSDRDIWEFARREGFIIVTADADFYELAATLGPPPKVVWLRRWTHPTRDAEFVQQQGLFAPRTLLRFLATTDPAEIPLAVHRLPSVAGYTVSLLRRFLERDEEGFSSCSA